MIKVEVLLRAIVIVLQVVQLLLELGSQLQWGLALVVHRL
jgi:hypothetical protein